MIKRVNKGFDSTKGEEGLFHIEFNNEKWNYKCVAPNQRDLIVGIIKVAMDEIVIEQ